MSKNIWPFPWNPKFDDIIEKMFEKYKISDKSIKSATDTSRTLGKIHLRTYQKFVGDYLGRSPYRGLLVYHGLGSGKTLTGYNLINILRRDTIILLPAALRPTWQKKRYMSKYRRHMINGKSTTFSIKFVSYNASNLLKQYKRLDPSVEFENINNFDNKLVIIDESHEFFQNVISGKATQAIEIYKYLLSAKNIKILLLTGTPIVGDPYEIAVCMNMLRGYMYTPDKRRVELFPPMRQDFYEYFSNSENKKMINVEIFKERVTGLVSYYKGVKDPDRQVKPEAKDIKVINAKMGKLQWGNYVNVRKKEEDIERKFRFLTKKFTVSKYKKPTRQSVGTYKTNSAKACNFAFPSDVEKIYKDILENYLTRIEYGKKIDHTIWESINERYKFTNKYGYRWPIKKEVAEIKWNIMVNLYTFAEIKDILPTLSGKMVALLKLILKPSTRDEKKFVYSKMKVLGTRIIGRMLTTYGFVQITDEKSYMNNINGSARGFIIIDGDTKNKGALVELFNRDDNTHGESVEVILGTSVMSKGVNLMAVRHTYIYEPQWRSTTIEQIRGRAVRMFSHKLLPHHDRTVSTYLFISTPLDRSILARITEYQGNVIALSDNIPSSLQSTDEFLYGMSLMKKRFNDEFLHALKEGAVDCRLNLYFNQDESIIECKRCDNVSDPSVRVYPILIKDHVIAGPTCMEEKNEIELYDIDEYLNLKRDVDNIIYRLDKDKNVYVEVGTIGDDGVITFG